LAGVDPRSRDIRGELAMEIPRHREVNMMDSPFAEEIKEVIVQLFRKDNTNEIEEWEALTPIELGVLSWHLGNFYYSPPW